jgi:hypothetical protein
VGGLNPPSRTAVGRAALKERFLSMTQNRDGHLMWTGRLDFRGAPVAPDSARPGSLISAVVLAKMLFREDHGTGGYVPKCDQVLCVHPDHWGRPHPPRKRKK